MKLTFDSVIDTCHHSTSKHDVIGPVHAEDGSSDDRIAYVVGGAGTRVDGLEDGTDALTPKDDENGLPPIETDADHGRSKSPVVHGPTKIEVEIIDITPAPFFPGSGKKIYNDVRTWKVAEA